MPVIISDETLQKAGMTEREAVVEIACWLFDAGKLHLWPAAQLAGLSRVEFEQELSCRKIAIYRPTIEDLAEEMAALEGLDRDRGRSQMKKRWKQISAEIQKVLIDEWDPIGVNSHSEAQDEYDNYVPGIYGLLENGADSVQIVNHLRQLETVSMGLSECGDGNRMRVAEMLLAIISKPR